MKIKKVAATRSKIYSKNRSDYGILRQRNNNVNMKMNPSNDKLKASQVEMDRANKTKNILYILIGIGVIVPLIAFIFLR